MLCALLPTAEAAKLDLQLDLPSTFWADVDNPLKDVISPGTRCPPRQSCPPAARVASNSASALRRYCASATAEGEWVACADSAPSEWLLLQPHYKDGVVTHRFEHLLPQEHFDVESDHELSLVDWKMLAPFPREWSKFVCVSGEMETATTQSLKVYSEASAQWATAMDYRLRHAYIWHARGCSGSPCE